jgi:hypothetical protein
MGCLWEGFGSLVALVFLLIMGTFLIAAAGFLGFVFVALLLALPFALFAA